jgi:hypothetical protein
MCDDEMEMEGAASLIMAAWTPRRLTLRAIRMKYLRAEHGGVEQTAAVRVQAVYRGSLGRSRAVQAAAVRRGKQEEIDARLSELDALIADKNNFLLPLAGLLRVQMAHIRLR